MKKLLLLPFLFFAAGISAQKTITIEKVTGHSAYVKGDSFEGVIFSDSYESGSLVKLPGKRFTPGETDINLVEKLLNKSLDTCRSGRQQSKYIRSDLKRYIRQYFGYVNDKGERIIYINAFRKGSLHIDKHQWCDQVTVVLDGGNAFWNIKINLDTHQLFEFAVNGEA